MTGKRAITLYSVALLIVVFVSGCTCPPNRILLDVDNQEITHSSKVEVIEGFYKGTTGEITGLDNYRCNVVKMWVNNPPNSFWLLIESNKIRVIQND